MLNLLKTDLQAAVNADDPLAKFVQDWVGDLSGSLEDAAAKIQDAVTQFRGLQQIIANFGQLGVSLGSTDDAAIAAAQDLATLSGGVDQLANAQAFYYQNVLSETDRLRIQFGDVEGKIVSFNDSLGLTGDAAIDTRKELKDYVDSLDLQTEAGRQAYVQALQLAPSITTLGQIFTQLGGDASAASMDLASFIQELDKISARASLICFSRRLTASRFGASAARRFTAGRSSRQISSSAPLTASQTRQSSRTLARRLTT